MVFPEVHAVFVLAFEGDAGAVHFGQAVGVVGLDAEGLDSILRAGFLGMGSAPMRALAQTSDRVRGSTPWRSMKSARYSA